ncbi:hypothetical protein RN001_010142 [Aquatica leii]|uniref:MADF domain-containing protein n=1 Tax=Aquatica leii TaxID=1421715 RepID=A0AAN7S8F9_9COLE|nr:hypothetical protein RN001_010142 [Aquatica leii]
MDKSIQKLYKEKHPELADIQEDSQAQKRGKSRKIYKVVYNGSDLDIWIKLTRLRDETKEDEWIALHHIRSMSVERFRTRVCSCHFREGKTGNGTEIYTHNVEKLFEVHHLTPETKKKRHAEQFDIENLPSTCTQKWRAQAMALSVALFIIDEKCKRRWLYLREKYVKERNGKSRGSEAVKQWDLFNSLRWLDMHIRKRKIKSNCSKEMQETTSQGSQSQDTIEICQEDFSISDKAEEEPIGSRSPVLLNEILASSPSSSRPSTPSTSQSKKKKKSESSRQ